MEEWLNIPNCYYRWHGEWADPEIEYEGWSLNYWDVVEFMEYELGSDWRTASVEDLTSVLDYLVINQQVCGES